MRISFDMDLLLVPYDDDGIANADCRLLSGELIRKGGIAMLRELQKSHELWIYTTSFRSPFKLKLSFLLKGVRIKRVINEQIHREIIHSYRFEKEPSKLPRHFGIELHIDDSPGVKEEGERHGFRVLQINFQRRSRGESWRWGVLSSTGLLARVRCA